MFIHNVYFWLKKSVTPAERKDFERELKRLVRLPYAAHGWAGTPAKTPDRPVTDHSFDYSSTLLFNTLADHDHYQDGCKDHKRFVERCRKYFERVVVYDVQPFGAEEKQKKAPSKARSTGSSAKRASGKTTRSKR